MKIRDYTKIAVQQSSDETITLRHLVGEETISCDGGAYVIPIPCGCGKSLGITSLISQFADDGILLLEKSNDECYKTKEALVRAGVDPKDIALVYMGSSEQSIMQNSPENISTYKVLIMPSIHLYITYLPAMLAYGRGGRAVDIEKHIGDTTSLLCSDEIRRFILIDEQPDFIMPFAEFSPSLATILYGVPCKKNALHSVEIDPTLHLKPMTLEQMLSCYNLKLRGNGDCFIKFKPKTRVQELKAMESLHYIHKNYKEIATCNNSTMTIDHWLKKLVVKGMRTNIYLFDGTADLLSNYSNRPFKLIPKSGKSYSSDIEFSEFDMGVERWLFESDIDKVLISRLFDYFREESDTGCQITGVPFMMKYERDRTFLGKVMKLCQFDGRILNAIRNADSTPITITLNDIHTLLPLKERRSRAYDPLIEKINREYNINLNVTKR